MGDSCSCSWERGTVDHIAGRGIQLGEGASGHTARRGGSSSYSWERGQLIIHLGEGQLIKQLGEEAAVIQLGEGQLSYS